MCQGRERLQAASWGRMCVCMFVRGGRATGLRMLVTRNTTTGELVDTPDGQKNVQFAGGYELRWQSLKFLDCDNIVPTLDELQKFQRPGDEDGGRLLPPRNTWGSPPPWPTRRARASSRATPWRSSRAT